jgi:hypothetical protein
MTKLKEYKLSNGLTVEILDKTYRYFGDYFFVELELNVCVTVAKNMFDTEDVYTEARGILKNDKPVYKRALTQRGVYEKDMDAAKEKLIKFFEENSLPYLEKPEFPKKFVFGKLKEAKKKLDIQSLREKLGE